MNEKLKNVLIKRYTAEIEDAKYKINCYSEQELIIPEHPDITGEVDKLLEAMSAAIRAQTFLSCPVLKPFSKS